MGMVTSYDDNHLDTVTLLSFVPDHLLVFQFPYVLFKSLQINHRGLISKKRLTIRLVCYMNVGFEIVFM